MMEEKKDEKKYNIISVKDLTPIIITGDLKPGAYIKKTFPYPLNIKDPYINTHMYLKKKKDEK